MAGIFISYRRDDSRHAAGRLADDLAEAFGHERIFRDIEGIDPGLDFTQALERALRNCDVMLVLIGPRWLDMPDAQGGRRLDQAGDWIRLEIATALARDIRVIPVLLEGAPLPSAEQLPEDLQGLCRRQAFELADGRWRGDVERLIDALARVPGLERRPAPSAADPAPVPSPAPVSKPAPAKSTIKPLLVGAVLGVVGLLVAVGLLVEDEFASNSESTSTAAMVDRIPAEPAPMPTPMPTPVGSTPDVSGLWRTTTGETYHFEQDGRQVRFTAEAGGQDIGGGRGQFEGGLLRLAMTLRINGAVMATVNCDMQSAPDGRNYSGMCVGPNGSFPAQMFR